MAERYLRHYLRHHPAPKGQKGTHYLISLKQVFTNQEVIDAFADDYIDGYLKQAPEDMEAVLDVYKKISTNTKAHVSAEAVYAHYKNLRKGADALDFEMTDEKGKKCRLSDFRGKAVYIDVWATWCGPCCAEIPYMEKLAAHYAKNKKIVLLSISLDENKTKWVKKLAADKPQWKQFICPDAFESGLSKNYDITGIPRFLQSNFVGCSSPLLCKDNRIYRSAHSVTGMSIMRSPKSIRLFSSSFIDNLTLKSTTSQYIDFFCCQPCSLYYNIQRQTYPFEITSNFTLHFCFTFCFSRFHSFFPSFFHTSSPTATV